MANQILFLLLRLVGEIHSREAGGAGEASAEQGNADAACRLASIYEKGLGCAIDIDKALYLYKHAKEEGCPRAMAELGRLYREGIFVPEDLLKAQNLFQMAISFQTKASDSERWGVLYAFADLARMYRMYGVEEDGYDIQ